MRSHHFHKYFLSIFILIFVCGKAIPQDEKAGKYWLFFKDKGTRINLSDPPAYLSTRAMERRANRGTGPVFDVHDFPVCQDYIARLERMGISIKAKSRWLNAVSAVLAPENIEMVRRLPFIHKIQPVRSYSRGPAKKMKMVSATRMAAETDHDLDYGLSYMQNNMNRIPEVHDLGFSGKGVLIGLLDTGFDYHDRPVF